MSTPRSLQGLLVLVLISTGIRAYQAEQSVAVSLPAPVQLTAQEDQQRLKDLLHITSLRRGADGRDA